jgi:hypothetical protein
MINTFKLVSTAYNGSFYPKNGYVTYLRIAPFSSNSFSGAETSFGNYDFNVTATNYYKLYEGVTTASLVANSAFSSTSGRLLFGDDFNALHLTGTNSNLQTQIDTLSNNFNGSPSAIGIFYLSPSFTGSNTASNYFSNINTCFAAVAGLTAWEVNILNGNWTLSASVTCSVTLATININPNASVTINNSNTFMIDRSKMNINAQGNLILNCDTAFVLDDTELNFNFNSISANGSAAGVIEFNSSYDIGNKINMKGNKVYSASAGNTDATFMTFSKSTTGNIEINSISSLNKIFALGRNSLFDLNFNVKKIISTGRIIDSDIGLEFTSKIRFNSDSIHYLGAAEALQFYGRNTANQFYDITVSVQNFKVEQCTAAILFSTLSSGLYRIENTNIAADRTDAILITHPFLDNSLAIKNTTLSCSNSNYCINSPGQVLSASFYNVFSTVSSNQIAQKVQSITVSPFVF